MKISKETQAIMHSFMGINTGMVVPVGSMIQSESQPKDQFAKCVVEEKFDVEFGIYDLSSFLKMLEMFEGAELTFHDEYVSIVKGRNKIDYYYVENLDFIIHGDFLDISDNQYVITFDLSSEDISNIQRVAGALTLDRMKFTNNNGNLICDVISNSNDSANKYSIELGKCSNANDFEFIMRVGENFRFFTDDYEIKIAKIEDVLVFCANAKNKKLNYQIALDRKSFYKD